MPGDDIFGFTSPTDVGKLGDIGFTNENDGRFGKRQGTYGALNTKYEFNRTVADGWWMAGSLFGAYYHIHDVTGLVDVNHLDFNGLSFEIEHRVVERRFRPAFCYIDFSRAVLGSTRLCSWIAFKLIRSRAEIIC